MELKIDDEELDETEDELPEPPRPLVTASREELLAPMQQELYGDARTVAGTRTWSVLDRRL